MNACHSRLQRHESSSRWYIFHLSAQRNSFRVKVNRLQSIERVCRVARRSLGHLSSSSSAAAAAIVQRRPTSSIAAVNLAVDDRNIRALQALDSRKPQSLGKLRSAHPSIYPTHNRQNILSTAMYM